MHHADDARDIDAFASVLTALLKSYVHGKKTNSMKNEMQQEKSKRKVKKQKQHKTITYSLCDVERFEARLSDAQQFDIARQGTVSEDVVVVVVVVVVVNKFNESRQRRRSYFFKTERERVR